ncbi:virulence factor TspB C-terminal domain-related protein [Chitinimonas lacunae]|uniref:Virulence factor TspB C-terminal domain-related protein n=1 Tax=Chitinimonas lacunae TaxID=1963018 RepID=A0ABV8MMG0_9NEIS
MDSLFRLIFLLIFSAVVYSADTDQPQNQKVCDTDQRCISGSLSDYQKKFFPTAKPDEPYFRNARACNYYDKPATCYDGKFNSDNPNYLIWAIVYVIKEQCPKGTIWDPQQKKCVEDCSARKGEKIANIYLGCYNGCHTGEYEVWRGGKSREWGSVFTGTKCGPSDPTKPPEQGHPCNGKKMCDVGAKDPCPDGYGSIQMGNKKKCIKNGEPENPKNRDDSECKEGQIKFEGKCQNLTDIFPDSGDGNGDGNDDGSGDGNGNGDGNGDGNGNGNGNGNGDGQGSDFCKKNPESIACKKSEFGGSCGSFSCKGDAILCAMAKEQHKRNCEMFETPNEYSEKGKKAVAGDAEILKSLPKNSMGDPVNISEKLFTGDDEFLGGSASCPPPRVVSIALMGRVEQIAIEWTPACTLAGYMKPVLLLVAALAALKIILGGMS